MPTTSLAVTFSNGWALPVRTGNRHTCRTKVAFCPHPREGLLADHFVADTHLLTRRELPMHPKLIRHIVDFKALRALTVD